MKKWIGMRIFLAVCLMAGLVVSPLLGEKAYAAETTVQGTVAAGTTADLLMLSTKDGKMEIKIDGSTDVSEARILLPETKLSVSISHGSDGYWHAVKITYNGPVTGVTIDSSTTSTVTGTISDKTTGDVLFVNTPQGEMQIKYDQTTNISGCSVLVANKKYTITCARGSDAYMHATVITDASSSSTGSNSGSAVFVNGTVGKNTTDSLLYLSTKDGMMEIKVDAGADTTGGKWKKEGTKLTVYFYRGSDAYIHANKVVEGTTVMPASSNAPAATNSFTGTVANNTTENVLFLSTKDGVMEFKIDNNANTMNGMIHTPGNKLTVSAYYGGADGYWHASATTGVKDSCTANINNSSTVNVSGTVSSRSTEKILYLDTKEGTMEIKMDSVRSLNNCKVLITGKKVTVSCAIGSDEYWHAYDITA